VVGEGIVVDDSVVENGVFGDDAGITLEGDTCVEEVRSVAESNEVIVGTELAVVGPGVKITLSLEITVDSIEVVTVAGSFSINNFCCNTTCLSGEVPNLSAKTIQYSHLVCIS